jgi:hypothetical protein
VLAGLGCAGEGEGWLGEGAADHGRNHLPPGDQVQTEAQRGFWTYGMGSDPQRRTYHL